MLKLIEFEVSNALWKEIKVYEVLDIMCDVYNAMCVTVNCAEFAVHHVLLSCAAP